MHKEYFVVKKIVQNVRIKAFWYTNWTFIMYKSCKGDILMLKKILRIIFNNSIQLQIGLKASQKDEVLLLNQCKKEGTYRFIGP